MTKILFVDDDAIIRRGIAGKIDWNRYGWELIYAARDCMEALDYIKNDQPDIILTDIKLPGMSGIEMAQIVQNYYPDVKFVFISGYKDFEYAQQVLKLNAIDYLTKPVDSDELVGALKKANGMIKKEQSANYILYSQYPQIKRSYISGLMKDKFQQLDNSFFTAFDINISDGLGIVGFAELPHDDSISYERVKTEMESFCNDLTVEYKGSFFFCTDNLQIFMIYTNHDSKESSALYNHLSRVEGKISAFSRARCGKEEVAFFYGSVMHNLNELYFSYRMALENVNSKVESLLFDIKHYIEQHYAESDLSLAKISDTFSMNHCYLTSVFKKKFDISLYDYIINVRMKNAAQLILDTDLKNYDIATATGYANPQYFSISFKKFYNCTVTQYRKTYENEG
jgi:two-component system, response regulator YesN